MSGPFLALLIVGVAIAFIGYWFWRDQPHKGETWGSRTGPEKVTIVKSGDYIVFQSEDGEKCREWVGDFTDKWKRLSG